MKEFKNKVAAITGSATGIGRAFAEEAAKRGMRLALIDINTEGLEETKAICEKAGAAKVVTIKTDVTKYEEVRFSILRVMQEYGQLDLMFANAGIATAGWVYNHPPQDWAWAMNTNVLGLTYYVHEVLPIFKQQGTPRLRRSVPVRGCRGEPHVQGAAYAHTRADPRTPQTHRVRPRARGSAAREIRPAAEILIRSLSFRSTPKAPPVFRRGFCDFCPVSIPAHSSCSMRENASRNVSRLRTVSCTSGAPSTVTA